jgi:EAL domain-containing protein (putative c-di-GMP-specific phosphodiesterase class I)
MIELKVSTGRANRVFQLYLHVQPILQVVSIENNLLRCILTGAEGLLRVKYRSAEFHLGQFFTILEAIPDRTYRDIVYWEVTEAVLSMVLAFIQTWEREYPQIPGRVSFNVWPEQMGPRLVELVRGRMSIQGISPERLLIEILEHDGGIIELLQESIYALRAVGVGVCIDDWPDKGSPGRALVLHGLDRIKLSGNWLELTKEMVFHGEEIGPEPIRSVVIEGVEDLRVFRSIMGRSFGSGQCLPSCFSRQDCRVTYEGGFDPLRCQVPLQGTYFQGFFFARPVPVEVFFTEYLGRRRGVLLLPLA